MNMNQIDLNENNLYRLDHELLTILLKDRSSGNNIIWATDNYTHKGTGFQRHDHIEISAITGYHGSVVKPRVEKSKKEQLDRIKQKAEVLFVLEDGTEVGYALYFHNFSTFLGRAGIYLEDLFVKPEHRGKGYGKAMLKKLASIAVECGCGRLEWWCLDWNKRSIDFYLSLGAEPMSDWTSYRIAGDTLKRLAE